MLEGKRVIAIVPARSGSKGIPNKNMRTIGGHTLIGLVGICLQKLSWIDSSVITTDSEDYAREGEKFGLAAPFFRPHELSTDAAGAVETITHALIESERHYNTKYDIILIIEPTSPLRRAEDIEQATRKLIDCGGDSVVTVSLLCSKYHPAKALAQKSKKLLFYEARGAQIVSRQSLDSLYWRNGVCYALTRECLLEKKAIFTDKTFPLIIDREVVNIDDPIELEWADFLYKREKNDRSE